MAEEWLLALEIPLVELVIPVFVIIGRRASGRVATALGAGALLSFLLLWLLGTAGEYTGASPLPAVAPTYLLFAGALLLLGGWAVALADAAGERRSGWVALLAVVVYLACVAFIQVPASPYSACLFQYKAPYCSTQFQGEQLLLLAAGFVGPAAVIAYALLAPRPRRPDALPEGVQATPLGAAADNPDALAGGEPGAGD
jgi:hypothetical protein